MKHCRNLLVWFTSHSHLITVAGLHTCLCVIIWQHCFIEIYEAKKRKYNSLPTNTNFTFKVLFSALDGATAAVALFNMAIMTVLMCRHLLTMTRKTVLRKFIPLNYNVQIHKYLGYVLAIQIFFIVNLNTWSLSTMCYEYIKGYELVNGCAMFYSEIQITGYLILICFCIMLWGVCVLAKGKSYEIFYYSHQVVLIMYFLLAIHCFDVEWRSNVHDRRQCIYWIGVPVVLYLFDRVLNYYRCCRTTLRAAILTMEPKSIWLHLAQPKCFQYVAGQWIYVAVKPLSKRQWHPFTISSAPKGDNTLRTVIRCYDKGWTEDLFDLLWLVTLQIPFEEDMTYMRREKEKPPLPDKTKTGRSSHSAETGSGTKRPSKHSSLDSKPRHHSHPPLHPEKQFDASQKISPPKKFVSQMNHLAAPPSLPEDQLMCCTKRITIEDVTEGMKILQTATISEEQDGEKSRLTVTYNDNDKSKHRVEMPHLHFKSITKAHQWDGTFQVVGPFGSAAQDVIYKERTILIGTGSGITPYLSHAHEYLQQFIPLHKGPKVCSANTRSRRSLNESHFRSRKKKSSWINTLSFHLSRTDGFHLTNPSVAKMNIHDCATSLLYDNLVYAIVVWVFIMLEVLVFGGMTSFPINLLTDEYPSLCNALIMLSFVLNCFFTFHKALHICAWGFHWSLKKTDGMLDATHTNLFWKSVGHIFDITAIVVSFLLLFFFERRTAQMKSLVQYEDYCRQVHTTSEHFPTREKCERFLVSNEENIWANIVFFLLLLTYWHRIFRLWASTPSLLHASNYALPPWRIQNNCPLAKDSRNTKACSAVKTMDLVWVTRSMNWLYMLEEEILPLLATSREAGENRVDIKIYLTSPEVTQEELNEISADTMLQGKLIAQRPNWDVVLDQLFDKYRHEIVHSGDQMAIFYTGTSSARQHIQTAYNSFSQRVYVACQNPKTAETPRSNTAAGTQVVSFHYESFD